MSKTSGVNTQVLSTNASATERTAHAKSTAPKTAVRESTKTNKAATTASLSGTGSKLAAAATDTDDVRTSKVAALKSAIDSGSYEVPASAVADKIISSLLG